MKKFTLSFIFLLLFSTTAVAYDVSYIQSFGEIVLLAGKGVPSEVAIFDAKTMKVIDVVTFKPEKNALIAVSKKPNYPTEITIGPVPVVIVPAPTSTPTPVRPTASGSTYQASGTTTYLSPNDPAITWRSATDEAKSDFCVQAIKNMRSNLSRIEQAAEALWLLGFMDSAIGNGPELDDVYARETLAGIMAMGFVLRDAELEGKL